MTDKDDALQLRPNRVPTPLRPGEKTTAIITMENTGETTWTRAKSYDLRPARGSDDELRRVHLGACEPGMLG